MFAPAGSKRPIRLKFDFVDEDQALEGYRTLNLLNATNDPTFLRTVLYSEIAREYIPAPKVGYVRLVINGENWGVYQNQQHFNNDFLEDSFGERGGARWQVPGSPNGRGGMEYLGEGIDPYRTIYEIESSDDEQSWIALIHLFRILNETPLDRLEAELEPILDIDEVLRFLALDVVLANGDGYWTRASDFYVHQGLDGRFRVLPHDMNEGLAAGGGGGGRGGGRGGGAFPGAPGGGGGDGNASLDPLVGLNDASKPLRSRLLAVPELRDRYLAYVRQIAEENLDWAVLGPRVAELRNLIEEEVRRDTRKLYTIEAFEAGFETGANSLKGFADARRSFLLSATAEAAR
jgi:spore coat protein CotH